MMTTSLNLIEKARAAVAKLTPTQRTNVLRMIVQGRKMRRKQECRAALFTPPP